jgi:hypothetical protein
MTDYNIKFNIKSYDKKIYKVREYKYYVNDKGIHKDIGKDCKGHFFDTLQEVHKFWININTAPEA